MGNTFDSNFNFLSILATFSRIFYQIPLKCKEFILGNNWRGGGRKTQEILVQIAKSKECLLFYIRMSIQSHFYGCHLFQRWNTKLICNKMVDTFNFFKSCIINQRKYYRYIYSSFILGISFTSVLGFYTIVLIKIKFAIYLWVELKMLYNIYCYVLFMECW